MGKLRTKAYTLRDGQEVTCGEVASKIGISVSAARNRLNRSDDPDLIFAAHSINNGGQPKKIKPLKPPKILHYEDEMWKLVMQMGRKKYD